MALTRRLARPLLASNFVVGGLDALRSPAAKSEKARAVTEPLHELASATSEMDTETLVRINGGVQVVAGVLLAMNKFHRVACLALMGSLIPTIYAGHRFWEETDSAIRAQQRMQFAKNLGLLGGLIFAAVDTEGSPRRTAGSSDAATKPKVAVAGVSAAAAAASKSGKRAARRARRVGGQLKDSGFDAAHRATEVREELRSTRDAVSDAISRSSEGAAHALQRSGALVASATRGLEPLAGAVRANETLAKLGEHHSTS